MTHLHAIDLALSATYAALDRNNSPAPVPAKPPRNGDGKCARRATSAVRPRVAGATDGEGARLLAAGDSFRHALALSLAHETAPDPLIRRDADGTWFLHDGEWHPVGRLPARVREAYLRHEIEKERAEMLAERAKE